MSVARRLGMKGVGVQSANDCCVCAGVSARVHTHVSVCVYMLCGLTPAMEVGRGKPLC